MKYPIIKQLSGKFPVRQLVATCISVCRCSGPSLKGWPASGHSVTVSFSSQ